MPRDHSDSVSLTSLCVTMVLIFSHDRFGIDDASGHVQFVVINTRSRFSTSMAVCSSISGLRHSHWHSHMHERTCPRMGGRPPASHLHSHQHVARGWVGWYFLVCTLRVYFVSCVYSTGFLVFVFALYVSSDCLCLCLFSTASRWLCGSVPAWCEPGFTRTAHHAQHLIQTHPQHFITTWSLPSPLCAEYHSDSTAPVFVQALLN